VTCRPEVTLRIGLTNAKDNLERVARKAVRADGASRWLAMVEKCKADVAEAKASHDRHRATCLECSQ
jgi:hypothetical protein